MKKITIVGGGLAGLICGIQLAKKGVPSMILEKKNFPVHKVCGEYISNETKSYLNALGVFPNAVQPKDISKFQLSSIRGLSATMPLDLGGFAISRFYLDAFLAEKASKSGVEIVTNCEVNNIAFDGDKFSIQTSFGTEEADIVVGAYGKRSRLDLKLDRPFMKKRSPYVGVKYHVKTDAHPDGLISLHNFHGGYCGLVNIENNLTNICYLASRDQVRRFKNLSEFEQHVVWENPHLKRILSNSDMVIEKPLVINEISFETKQPVENHLLMAGDAAGMITPLCGNGMAMAIHSGKIVAECIEEYVMGRSTRLSIEKNYSKKWKKQFETRLAIGRAVQKLFGSRAVSDLSVRLMLNSRLVSTAIMKYTHGDPF
jgi:menaquinone-9 beta-reductase